MKIKTVWAVDPNKFDIRVNLALEEGYQLVRREVLRAANLDDSVFYAELVLPDEPEEQEPPVPFTPLEALKFVQDTCQGTSYKDCQFACPLRPWCEQLCDGGDPTDWDLTKLEADA